MRRFFRKCFACLLPRKRKASTPPQLLIHQLFHCSNQSPLNPPCWQVTPQGCRPCPTPPDPAASCGAAGFLSVRRSERVGVHGDKRRKRSSRRECLENQGVSGGATQASTDTTLVLILWVINIRNLLRYDPFNPDNWPSHVIPPQSSTNLWD